MEVLLTGLQIVIVALIVLGVTLLIFDPEPSPPDEGWERWS